MLGELRVTPVGSPEDFEGELVRSLERVRQLEVAVPLERLTKAPGFEA